MIRAGISMVIGFIMVYFQSLIVMKINGYTSIQFDNMTYLITVWIVNVFLVFSMLVHLQPWFVKIKLFETRSNEE
jgi:hypothetical protein